MSPDIASIARSFGTGEFDITVHAYEEMGKDGITAVMLRAAMGHENLDLIEDYPEAERGPCCLVLVHLAPTDLIHVVVAYQCSDGRPKVITVYRPDPRRWHPDCRRRRKIEET